MSLSVKKFDWVIQAKLFTRIQFSYEAVFEMDPDEQIKFRMDYPTLTFAEGLWDDDTDTMEITLQGGYTDLVKWILECGEFTEWGKASNIQSIEIDWDSSEQVVSGL